MSITYARKLNIKDFIFAHELIQQNYTSIKDANDLEQYLSKQSDGGALYNELVDKFLNPANDISFFEWKTREDAEITAELMTRIDKHEGYAVLARICLDILQSNDNDYNKTSILHDPSLPSLSDATVSMLLRHLRMISNETQTPIVNYACLAFGLKTHIDSLQYCTEKSPLITRLHAYEKRTSDFVQKRKELNAEVDMLRRSYYKNIHGKIFQIKKARKKTLRKSTNRTANSEHQNSVTPLVFDYLTFLTEYSVASYCSGIPLEVATRDFPQYFATRQLQKVRDNTRISNFYDSFAAYREGAQVA